MFSMLIVGLFIINFYLWWFGRGGGGRGIFLKMNINEV